MAQRVLPLLPERVQRAIRDGLFSRTETPGEIRLRVGRCASLTFFSEQGNVNIPLHIEITEAEAEAVLAAACKGSVYAYEETLKEGFLPLGGGIRLGVVGQGVCQNGKVIAMRGVSSLVFRLPHRVKGAADGVYRLFCRMGKKRGILVCGAPGCGKTTALREFVRLAGGSLRVCAVDCRGEFAFDVGGGMVDLLAGYPMITGIEIAVRTLSPQVVVCDEIAAADVGALMELSRFGVPLLASVHADAGEGLLRRPAFARLWESDMFGVLCSPKGDVYRERQGMDA